MASSDHGADTAPAARDLRPLPQRHAEAEAEANAAVRALNASRHGDPGHEAALRRYYAARATLGTREMLEETERQRPGALAYGGARADTTSPHWYRHLLDRSSTDLARLGPDGRAR